MWALIWTVAVFWWQPALEPSSHMSSWWSDQIKGYISWNVLPIFPNLPFIHYYVQFQMKTWKIHLKYHVYCIWILSKELTRVSKILFKGILELSMFTSSCFLTCLASYFDECSTFYETIVPQFFPYCSRYLPIFMCTWGY